MRVEFCEAAQVGDCLQVVVETAMVHRTCLAGALAHIRAHKGHALSISMMEYSKNCAKLTQKWKNTVEKQKWEK